MHRVISLTELQKAEKTEASHDTNTAAVRAWQAGKPLTYISAVLFGDTSVSFIDVAQEFFFELAQGEPNFSEEKQFYPSIVEVAEEFFCELRQGQPVFSAKDEESDEEHWARLWEMFSQLHMGNTYD